MGINEMSLVIVAGFMSDWVKIRDDESGASVPDEWSTRMRTYSPKGGYRVTEITVKRGDTPVELAVFPMPDDPSQVFVEYRKPCSAGYETVELKVFGVEASLIEEIQGYLK